MMDIRNIKWEKSASLKDGSRFWDSSESGIQIAKCFTYSEYTSSNYVSRLIETLLKKTGSSVFAATCISSKRENIIYDIDEIEEFRQKFDSVYWDVWAIASGELPPDTDDLINLIKLLKPNNFAVYLDRDGGMFVAINC